MKNVLNCLLGCLIIVVCCSFLGLLFSDTRKPKTKMAHKIINQINQKFTGKYGLQCCGISEASPEGKYTNLGIEFSYPYILTKDQGRILLLECVEDALQAYNSYPEFRPHMDNYPFNGRNIIITIFIKPKKNPDVYYPDIRVFSFYNDKLRYDSYTPESYKACRYFTEEKETYEEALKIIEEQYQSGYWH